MNTKSRTYKTLRNSSVALLLFFFELILNFVSRKVFLDYLGTEILGINTTAKSIIQCLNLVELGIGSAIVFALYKPLLEKDERTVSEIVALQGWFYKKVALIVIAGSVGIMLFFPVIFAKTALPLWYSYATFSSLLYSSLLGYFVNYKQVALTADQQDYKVQFTYKGITLIKLLFQIILIYKSHYGYIYWLLCEVLFASVSAIALSRTVRKSFPYLGVGNLKGSDLAKKYPEVLVKIKQLFFHKFGAFALSQTSPIIIYAYSSLTMVTLYGNYTIIVAGLVSFLNAIFNSVGAGIGNLIAEGNTPKVIRVFRELFSTRFLIVTSMSVSLYFLADPFVTLWIGEKYHLDFVSVILIVIMFYMNTSGTLVWDYVAAYGLFKDIWAPVAEAILNIGLSILLGYFYDLHGILLGVIISRFLISLLWKPYFLFNQGFRTSIYTYIKLYIKHVIVFFLSFAFFIWLFKHVPFKASANFAYFGLYALFIFVGFSVIEGVLLYLTEKGMRDFVRRICHSPFKR